MIRALRFIALVLVLGLAPAGPAAAAPDALHLYSAQLAGRHGVRTVALPHVLKAGDYDPGGSRVRYRLDVDLPAAPSRPLGVFVGKLSLAGAFYLNGQFVDTCARGEIERIRCLHRPLMFTPASHLWRAGGNTLEFEVYANDRQTTGLSAVLIGDADRLHQEVLAPRLWWTVTVKEGLAFASLALGILCLAISLGQGTGSAFAWWGWTNVFFAASAINNVADELPLPIEVVNWLILVSRLDTAILLMLALLSVFGKLARWQWRLGLAYAVAVNALAYATESHRWVMVAAYVPILALGPVLIACAIRWTLQESNRMRLAMCAVMMLLFALGVRDWAKFGDADAFEYQYLIPYGFSAALVFVGLLLNAELARSLRQSRATSADLEQRVAARTSELQTALNTIGDLEQSALQLTESIPVGTFVLRTTPGGRPRLTFVSRRCLEMLALRLEDLVANPFLALDRLDPADRAALHRPGFAAGPDPAPILWQGRVTVAGETRWLSVEAIPRSLQGGEFAFEGVVVDITAHKEAQAQLKATYERLTEAAVQQSKFQEREHLLQEMHDGFGSQLATARLMAERGLMKPDELPVVLQECMADLYLIADTLSGTAHTLEEALADFRFRTDRRIQALPVTVEWNVEVNEKFVLPQRTTLQVLRVIQEAVNNALRHSQARNLRVSAAHDSPSGLLRISVLDDGIGISATAKHGRGIHNMRHRATSIGAGLSISAGTPGTRVTLTVPAHPSPPVAGGVTTTSGATAALHGHAEPERTGEPAFPEEIVHARTGTPSPLNLPLMVR